MAYKKSIIAIVLTLLCLYHGILLKGNSMEKIQYSVVDVDTIPDDSLIIKIEIINDKYLNVTIGKNKFNRTTEVIEFIKEKKAVNIVLYFESKASSEYEDVFENQIINFSYQNKIGLYGHWPSSIKEPSRYSRYIFKTVQTKDN